MLELLIREASLPNAVKSLQAELGIRDLNS